jgi:predicted flap endonuclease-1-like 5' DNA nuclease
MRLADEVRLRDLSLSAAAKRMVKVQSHWRDCTVGDVRRALPNDLRKWKGIGPQVEQELCALVEAK